MWNPDVTVTITRPFTVPVAFAAPMGLRQLDRTRDVRLFIISMQDSSPVYNNGVNSWKLWPRSESKHL